jgi:hypothetical protein
MAYEPFLSGMERNKARFVCSVMQSEERVADCFELVAQTTMGRVLEERRGCQLCVKASKCPATHMLQEERNSAGNVYFSASERVMSVSDWVAKRVSPIIVIETWLNNTPMSTEDRAKIIQANEDRTPVKGAKPTRTLGKVERSIRATEPRERPEPETSEPDTFDAATSGDMAAAITAAAAAPPKPLPVTPAPKPAVKPAAPVPARSGMSLVEIARMKLKQKEASA